MLHRKGVAKLAVCAAMACATVAGAEEINSAVSLDQTDSRFIYRIKPSRPPLPRRPRRQRLPSH